MKILILFCIFSFNLSAADKVYSIEKTAPEIKIIDPQKKLDEQKKLAIRDRWYVALVAGSLDYNLPSTVTNTKSFENSLTGLIIGKKTDNQILKHDGNQELSAEWHRYNRDAASTNKTSYSQKVDLYEINLFQNFNLKPYLSWGLGIAPVYLTAEQSILSNSIAEIGYQAMLKLSLTYSLFRTYELDFAFKASAGRVSSNDLKTYALSLGLNFE